MTRFAEPVIGLLPSRTSEYTRLRLKTTLRPFAQIMKIDAFLTEQFFTEYEFSSPYLLAASDCETMSIGDLLAMSGSSLAQLGEIQLGYTESQGNPQLRKQISEMYLEASPDDIVVLTSPVEGIYLAMQTLLEKEDEVVALRPAYDALTNVAQHLCHQVLPWNLVPGTESWTLNFEELDSLVNEKTKLIIVNFPHNPTGYLPSPEEFERLVAFVRDRGIWLFCDEIYRGLEWGHTIPSAADLYEKSIVLCGLSKTYGLPGLRAGWVVIRDETIRTELINWKHYTTICPASPTEFLASQAIRVRAALAERSKSIIEANLELCETFFEKHHQLFTWRRPQAGSVAFVEMNQNQLVDSSAEAFCHNLARDKGIVLLPGTCLGYEDRFVRMGLGRSGFQAALNALDQCLDQGYTGA